MRRRFFSDVFAGDTLGRTGCYLWLENDRIATLRKFLFARSGKCVPADTAGHR
jgi:hypothetical protein